MGKNEFLKEFKKLRAAFLNTRISELTIDVYWSVVKAYDIALFRPAIQEAVETCEFFPAPATIKRIMDARICPQGEEVLLAIRNIIAATEWTSEGYHPVVLATMEDIGGIYDARNMSDTDLRKNVRMFYPAVARHYIACRLEGRKFRIAERHARTATGIRTGPQSLEAAIASVPNVEEKK